MIFPLVFPINNVISLTALQHGIWMHEDSFKKTCTRRRKKRGVQVKPTAKPTRLFQAKMFPQNGTTGQIDQFSRGKSLVGKEVP